MAEWEERDCKLLSLSTVIDAKGFGALEPAVLLGADDVVSQLLELGFPSDLENAHGWTPLNEAIALQNRQIVKLIYSFQKKHVIEVRSQLG